MAVNFNILGKCDNCDLLGLLAFVPFLTDKDVYELGGDMSGEFPRQLVCATCAETPSGVKSSNLIHKRLPEAEYLVPYS